MSNGVAAGSPLGLEEDEQVVVGHMQVHVALDS